MDGSRDYPTKKSKSDKDKYHGITHMWNLILSKFLWKNDVNELIYQTETDSQIFKKIYDHQRRNVEAEG